MLPVIFLTACGDDEGPDPIVPSNGQSKTENVEPAGQSMQIRFNAADVWTAHVEYAEDTSSRSADEWITLQQTSGPAGDCTLNYSVESNRTGVQRQADIVILCQGASCDFTIIQDPDETPLPEEELAVHVKIKNYGAWTDSREYIGESECTFYYNQDGTPSGFMFKEQEENEMEPSVPASRLTEYVDILTEGRITFNGNEVTCNIRTTEKSSLNSTVKTETSEHHAVLSNGRVVSGWYKYDDEDKVTYELSYNDLGQLVKSVGHEDIDTYTHNVEWTDGNISRIKLGGIATANFTSGSQKNLHTSFDVNMLWNDDNEVLDFAVGDCTRIWSIFGMTGTHSKKIFENVTDDNLGHSDYKITVEKNTAQETKAVVTDSKSLPYEIYEYEITYPSSLK